jgi:hypothetical protein
MLFDSHHYSARVQHEVQSATLPVTVAWGRGASHPDGTAVAHFEADDGILSAISPAALRGPQADRGRSFTRSLGRLSANFGREALTAGMTEIGG